jgi:hypothetical protein
MYILCHRQIPTHFKALGHAWHHRVSAASWDTRVRHFYACLACDAISTWITEEVDQDHLTLEPDEAYRIIHRPCPARHQSPVVEGEGEAVWCAGGLGVGSGA